jgi:hypothetical protein
MAPVAEEAGKTDAENRAIEPGLFLGSVGHGLIGDRGSYFK